MSVATTGEQASAAHIADVFNDAVERELLSDRAETQGFSDFIAMPAAPPQALVGSAVGLSDGTPAPPQAIAS